MTKGYDLDKWISGVDIVEEFPDIVEAISDDLEELFDERQPNFIEGLRLVDLPVEIAEWLEEALALTETLRDKLEQIGTGFDERKK